MFVEKDGVTTVSLPLGPSGSVFVVFPKNKRSTSSIASLGDGGTVLLSTTSAPAAKIVIRKAVYGVLGDPARTRDVRAKVQKMVNAGEDRFQVARLAAGDDPAVNVVKTAIVDFTIDGQHGTARGTDQETVVLASVPASEHLAELHRDPAGQLMLEAWKPGQYQIEASSGRKKHIEYPAFPTRWT